MRKIRLLILLPALACLSGCLEKPGPEKQPVLTADRTSVSVAADLAEGRNLVETTLTVTSNRSWSASVPAECDWITLEPGGLENPGGQTREVHLTLKFLDNESEQARSADVFIGCEGAGTTVHVSQEAISYRLSLISAAESFLNLSPYGTSVPLSIASNTSWTAALETGATASVSLSTASGKYSSVITVTLAPNNDLEAGREAVIVISATGGQSLRIPLTQKQAPAVPNVNGDGINNYDYEDHGTV